VITYLYNTWLCFSTACAKQIRVWGGGGYRGRDDGGGRDVGGRGRNDDGRGRDDGGHGRALVVAEETTVAATKVCIGRWVMYGAADGGLGRGRWTCEDGS
jgi:hypothetical protein